MATRRHGWGADRVARRDARMLGVALRRVVVRRGHRFAALEAARMPSPRGFHPLEQDRDGGFCWTDGDAALPADLPVDGEGQVDLFLHVRGTTRYPMEGTRLAE